MFDTKPLLRPFDASTIAPLLQKVIHLFSYQLVLFQPKNDFGDESHDCVGVLRIPFCIPVHCPISTGLLLPTSSWVYCITLSLLLSHMIAFALIPIPKACNLINYRIVKLQRLIFCKHIFGFH